MQVGKYLNYLEAIWGWLSGNGLAGILMGSLGVLLLGGLPSIVGALGSLGTSLLGGLANVISGIVGGLGPMLSTLGSSLGAAGLVAAAGYGGWKFGEWLNENTGIQAWLADKIDKVTGLDKAAGTKITTLTDINADRAKRGLPPIEKHEAQLNQQVWRKERLQLRHRLQRLLQQLLPEPWQRKLAQKTQCKHYLFLRNKPKAFKNKFKKQSNRCYNLTMILRLKNYKG